MNPAMLASGSRQNANALLFAATQDRLHQPYRASLMEPSWALIEKMRSHGFASTVSGAGPCVLVLHHGDAPSLQAVCTALARRTGPIVGVTALQPGATDIPLERLLIERALSVNTAAAGGNASLMTIG